MFEPEVFRKQIYCVEESSCDNFGTFRRPPQCFGAHTVIWRPENCSPLVTAATPLIYMNWTDSYSRVEAERDFCDESVVIVTLRDKVRSG